MVKIIDLMPSEIEQLKRVHPTIETIAELIPNKALAEDFIYWQNYHKKKRDRTRLRRL